MLALKKIIGNGGNAAFSRELASHHAVLPGLKAVFKN
jgi:hypothetical protein